MQRTTYVMKSFMLWDMTPYNSLRQQTAERCVLDERTLNKNRRKDPQILHSYSTFTQKWLVFFIAVRTSLFCYIMLNEVYRQHSTNTS
jgi:hypothetical protein